jgi:hypothetical protein
MGVGARRYIAAELDRWWEGPGARCALEPPLLQNDESKFPAGGWHSS